MVTIKRKSLYFGARAVLDVDGMRVADAGRVEGTFDAEAGPDGSAFDGDRGNPEATLAAAHATCYAAAFASVLEGSDVDITQLRVQSVVRLDPPTEPGDAGYRVGRVDLAAGGEWVAPEGTDVAALAQQAEQVCPISGALREPVEVALVEPG